MVEAVEAVVAVEDEQSWCGGVWLYVAASKK